MRALTGIASAPGPSGMNAELLRIELAGGLALVLRDRCRCETVEADDSGFPTDRIPKAPFLAIEGSDLAEEGVGFGLPVLRGRLDTVFPGSFILCRSEDEARFELEFEMNLVERLARNGAGPATIRPASQATNLVKELFAIVHRRLPFTRRALTLLSDILRMALGMKTVFTPTRSLGTVRVAYRVDRGSGAIEMRADAGNLSLDAAQRLVFMQRGRRTMLRHLRGLRRHSPVRPRDRELAAGRGGEGRLQRPRLGRFLLGATQSGRRPLSREGARREQAVLGRAGLRPPSRSDTIRIPDRSRAESMTSILLIYPFFKPRYDNSQFRFPPLGLAYLASSLREAGRKVELLDCSFLGREEALAIARSSGAELVGIYSMITMREESLLFARELKDKARLLVAGGPLPSTDAFPFLADFDAVAIGEGERTMRELALALEEGRPFSTVRGIAYRTAGARGSPVGAWASTPARELEPDLDSLPFPARDLLPNAVYIEHGRRKYGHAITTIMSSRGCPFSCEFCSNAVFGPGYRERSPRNVADEVEDALSYGYDRIHFGDDVFTLKKERILAVCAEFLRRGLRFSWECLGRVDSIDREAAEAMRRAGCDRIFFGVESGNERILRIMKKGITPQRARAAIEAARAAGIKTGAFFILFYPGDDDDSVLETMRFASSLPLDYLSFSLPYPIPGTALHKRVADRSIREWRQPHGLLFDHCRIFDADFSEAKMKFGLVKGKIEFELQRRGAAVGSPALRLFRGPTDLVLRLLK